MHSVLLIAKREYLERVRTKSFLLITILMPAIFGAGIYISILSASKSGGGKHIVVASANTALAQDVVAQMQEDKDSGLNVSALTPVTEADHARLTQQVDGRQIDGYLWMEKQDGSPQPKATYAGRSAADFGTKASLEAAVKNAVLREQLQGRGLAQTDISTLLKHVNIDTLQVKNGKLTSSNTIATFLVAYVMMFLLYFSTVFYGMNVGRSIIEEKTSRVFEVMLSTVTPGEMMGGKLIGVGAAGLTQIGIWISLAAVFMGSSLAVQAAANGFVLHIPVEMVIFFVIYFLLGFLFYSALSAGFASTVNSEQEFQQFAFVIVFPMMIGFFLLSYVLGNPSAPLSVAVSLFPPCTPIVMVLRMAAQMPPFWQLALSVVLMIAAIYLVIWIASRIYRVGILMYGKRPNLPEIMRWLRYT